MTTILVPLGPDRESYFAQVDECDAVVLSQKWHLDADLGYAACSDWKHRRSIRLHRVIAKRMGLDTSMLIDHINGHRLDNHRANLRTVDRSQHAWNIGLSSRNTSGFKGVTWNVLNRNWNASIKDNGRPRHLGCFATAEEASAVYEAEALRLRGEYHRRK